MESLKADNKKMYSTLLIALGVLFSCWGLFYLDHETRSLTDLFKTGNLIALLIYFLPSFLICLFLYRFLSRKYDTFKSIFLSLIIGIAASYTLVISLMFLVRMFRNY